MSLRTYAELEQGTDEWLDVRRGIVTASVVGQLLSVSTPPPTTVTCPECGADAGSPCVSRARKEPTPIKTTHPTRMVPDDAPKVVEPSRGDVARNVMMLLTAERITGWSDPVFVNADMMRGTMDEPLARDLYSETYAPVTEVGFMVRDDWGYQIGYSPDGLVGDDGLIEVKSRRQKKHLSTILADAVPAENMAQIQCGLLVSGRSWCDYISYSGGMPMWRKRVGPDRRWFDAIIAAAEAFETSAAASIATYTSAVAGLPATERIDYFQEASV